MKKMGTVFRIFASGPSFLFAAVAVFLLLVAMASGEPFTVRDNPSEDMHGAYFCPIKHDPNNAFYIQVTDPGIDNKMQMYVRFVEQGKIRDRHEDYDGQLMFGITGLRWEGIRHRDKVYNIRGKLPRKFLNLWSLSRRGDPVYSIRGRFEIYEHGKIGYTEELYRGISLISKFRVDCEKTNPVRHKFFFYDYNTGRMGKPSG
jgi:hypothetical protein